jgi:hypothetical protein
MAKERYDKPSEVIASDGFVLVDGPDHVDVALTPQAARETGRRLITQAQIADQQERDASSSGFGVNGEDAGTVSESERDLGSELERGRRQTP